MGIFDGQGHVISGLYMNHSLEYVGLFGYSSNTTIKNIVFDESCYIESHYVTSSYAYVGSAIGYCTTYDGGKCVIGGIVNSASVTFSGNATDILYIGGIFGDMVSFLDYKLVVKNCVNYGSVRHLGTTYRPPYWRHFGELP